MSEHHPREPDRSPRDPPTSSSWSSTGGSTSPCETRTARKRPSPCAQATPTWFRWGPSTSLRHPVARSRCSSPPARRPRATATTGRYLTTSTAPPDTSSNLAPPAHRAGSLPGLGRQVRPEPPRGRAEGVRSSVDLDPVARRAHSADASDRSGATATASISISHSGRANDATSAMVSAG